MKKFLTDIFEYHHYFNQQLIGELDRHQAELPERTFPLFCHILNAQQIWNSRIRNGKPLGVHQVHDIPACLELNQQNYLDTLDIIDNDNLERTIAYQTFRGDAFSNTIRDILFHVANHTTHHRGQIISDFRQSGIAPIITDYIFYKR